MGYQKQNFVSGQVLNSAHLNHIENGIVEVESSVSTCLADKVTKEELKNIIDPTLSLSGKAAEAKATGDAVGAAEKDIGDLSNALKIVVPIVRNGSLGNTGNANAVGMKYSMPWGKKQTSSCYDGISSKKLHKIRMGIQNI